MNDYKTNIFKIPTVSSKQQKYHFYHVLSLKWASRDL